MTLQYLVALLRSTGYPVAFTEFKVDANNPPPNPPYIIYTTPSFPDFKADNINYHKVTDVNVELYTDKKDLKAEQTIEQLLYNNKLPYSSYQLHIDSEKLYQRVFEIRLIQEG